MSKIYRLGWAPELPSIKDWKMSVHPKKDVVVPPVSEDRRVRNPPVRDQGNLGSCVGFSVTYGQGWLRRTDRDKLDTTYSPLQMYYDARVRDGAQWKDVDAGAYIRDAMDSLREVGVAPETSWPYKIKRFANKPTPSTYKAAKRWKLGAHWRCETLDDMQTALALGFALIGGIVCYDSMFTRQVEKFGRIPMPIRTDTIVGGHALYFDMYDSYKKEFRFMNSWGTGWGDKGYGTIDYAYLADRNLADDFWAMESESPETTPWKD